LKSKNINIGTKSAKLLGLKKNSGSPFLRNGNETNLNKFF